MTQFQSLQNNSVVSEIDYYSDKKNRNKGF